MIPIISFVGRSEARGSIAGAVVAHLTHMGYRVGVISEAAPDPGAGKSPGSGYSRYRDAGAQAVLAVSPSGLMLQGYRAGYSLATLAHRYFADVDLVIGEGFEEARKISKIEVALGRDHELRKQRYGVIAVVTDLSLSADYVFRLEETEELADFIRKRYAPIAQERKEKVSLLVNGHNVPLKPFIQESLAGVVNGYIKTLKLNEEPVAIELRITS